MEDDVIIGIRTMIQNSEDHILSPECCIYRVPHRIRNQKEDAYTPQFISIGPFHYYDQRLQYMKSHKQTIFKRFTEETKTSLEELVCFAKQSMPQVRASYSEKIKLSDKELVELILVDATFIIELFCKFHNKDEVDDPNLSQLWLRENLHQDLILLENQLPFFVIEELYNIVYPRLNFHGDLPSFLHLTYEYFELFNIQQLEPDPSVGIKHFTDLLRFFNLQSKKPKRQKLLPTSDVLLYSASELREAGVKLRAGTNKCLLDLTFSGRVLEIPQITIDARTEILFCNMIALEQFRYPLETCITDYARILDCLINTNEDVDALIHKKIIRSHLGDSNNVATLFNSMREDTFELNFSS